MHRHYFRQIYEGACTDTNLISVVPMFEAGVQKLLLEWCSRDSKVIPLKTAEEGSVRQVGGGAK